MFDQPAPWGTGETLREWLLPRVLELTYSNWALQPFAIDCGWDGPSFQWDDNHRFLLRCELDAAFFHLYLPSDTAGRWLSAQRFDNRPRDETSEDLANLQRRFPTPRDAVAHIMNTFTIVRRKDEKKCGRFRTKRTILEFYDAMQQAIRTRRHCSTGSTPLPDN